MSLIGRKFLDKNGKILTVSSEEDGIVKMEENGSKVDIRVLNNMSYFTPYKNNIKINEKIHMSRNKNPEAIDPDEFFNTSNFGNVKASLENKNSSDFDYGKNNDVRNTYEAYVENPNDVYVVQQDTQTEMERVAAKYGIGTPNVKNNNDGFRFASNVEGDSPFVKVHNADVNVTPVSIPIPPHLQTYQQQQQMRKQNPVYIDDDDAAKNNIPLSNAPHLMQAMGVQPIADPFVEMFKKVKKNTDFIFSFEVENKIPKLAFIEMMEESYEVSIIDYLADDFVKTLLLDPSVLKNKIADEIRRLVENNVDKTETKIVNPTIKEKNIEIEHIIV